MGSARKHPIATVVLVAVMLAVLLIVLMRSVFADGDDAPASNDLSAVANTFPVPVGATVAFPDTVADDIATKGWNAVGTLDDACNAWRDAYRGWTSAGAMETGAVSGDYVPGRMCSLSGPKDTFRAELNVAVYGDDPRPTVTLTVRRRM